MVRDRDTPGPLAALILPVAVATVPVILFWQAFSLQGMFYYGDIVGQFYPMKVALDRSLAAGQLPLWTPDLMAGYPLHGEGEGGFLYLPGLLLSLLLSPVAALNYQIILHLVIAGLGMYAFCRVIDLDALSAAVGGALYMLSGFLIAHANHVSILSAAAWLPVLFTLAELMVTRPRPGLYAALLGAAIGLQFSAGHAQISLLSLMAVSLYVLFKAAGEFVNGQGLGRPATLLGVYALAVALGAGLAAPQLLPTLELAGESVRAGGLSGEFFTSFSLPPPYVVTFFLPFVHGDPLASLSPATAVEWSGYMGVLPVVLAIYACLFRRDHYTFFFLLLALAALVFAFGQWNPLYHHLERLPLFNLFRVPARFLYLYSFAVAALGALGFHSLLYPGLRHGRSLPRAVPVVAGAFIVVLWGLALNSAAELDPLLTLWQLLPWGLLLAALGLVLARGRLLMGTATFAVLAVALIGVDLYSFAGVYGHTFNATVPTATLTRSPGVLDVLRAEEEPYRVYTHERITPVAVGVRESLVANFALAVGVPSLSGYLPLPLRSYEEFAERLPASASLANLANVKYLLVPQSIEDDKETLRDNLANPFAPSPVGQLVEIQPTSAVAVQVESFLSHSIELPDGEVVADIVLSDGIRQEIIPLRVGADTAEWAYDRPDVRSQVKHGQPREARAWPASSAYPPQDHAGYTYTARLPLAREMVVTSLEVRPRAGQAFVHVDRLELVDRGGRSVPLGHAAGWGDYEIVYRNEAVAAFRNRDVLPRAIVVHRAYQAANQEAVWQRLLESDFDPAAEVVLGPGERPGALESLLAFNLPSGRNAGEASESVPAEQDGVQIVELTSRGLLLQASLTEPGYVVVADAYYPGWRAYVDGEQAPLLRANGHFRAVALPAGEYKVEMRYEPAVLGLGWIIAAIAALGLVGVAVVVPRAATMAPASWRRL